MKKSQGGTKRFKPRLIDRIVFGVLGVLQTLNGLYLIGPWYLDMWNNDGKAPIQNLFNHDQSVTTYGIITLVNGILLLYSAVGREDNKYYTPITAYSLLAGFLFRFYSLMGTLLVLESWRPPTYLSHAATVILMGAFWVWVKVSVRNVRPTE